MKKDKTIIFYLQTDAVSENSNGISKILVNIVKRLTKYNYKFIIQGKPLKKSIYRFYGETIYLHRESTLSNYLLEKYLFASRSDRDILLGSYKEGDILLVFGSFVKLSLLSLFPVNTIRICLIDSSARYYYNLKSDNMLKYYFARPLMICLESYYEVILRARGYTISYVSEKDKNFVKHLQKNCLVIPNGVNLLSEYTEIKDSSDYDSIQNLVFVGNLDYSPNRLAVDYIANQLCDFFPNLSFYIVGGGDHNLSKRYSSKRNLTFTGYVTDLSTYMNSRSIFISPIFSGTGLQNKILDAFAHGVPVIASPSSVTGINCIANVHYLLANTPNEFVSSIKLLMSDSGNRRALVKNSITLVKKEYDWEVVSRKYKELISGVGYK